jgi:hypothetical protein
MSLAEIAFLQMPNFMKGRRLPLNWPPSLPPRQIALLTLDSLEIRNVGYPQPLNTQLSWQAIGMSTGYVSRFLVRRRKIGL